jgi:hypothetical protein
MIANVVAMDNTVNIDFTTKIDSTYNTVFARNLQEASRYYSIENKVKWTQLLLSIGAGVILYNYPEKTRVIYPMAISAVALYPISLYCNQMGNDALSNNLPPYNSYDVIDPQITKSEDSITSTEIFGLSLFSICLGSLVLYLKQ